MIELKAHALKVQKLENRAAERAGLRFQFLDEEQLFGKKGKAYIERYVDWLIKDVTLEILEAVRLGSELREAINAKV